MKRLGFCAVLLFGLGILRRHVGPSRHRRAGCRRRRLAPTSPGAAASPWRRVMPPAPSAPPQVFQKYCFECHGTDQAEGRPQHRDAWSRSRRHRSAPTGRTGRRSPRCSRRGRMPPMEATSFPTDAERAAAAAWIRTSLKAYEDAHAGEPGRVTVRRLTSAEYAYAIRDLTGIDVKVGIDASSDSVGGEGFANFGDVQFVQDESIERYLEAAKLVADHAVIGAGPLEFYTDPGKTGLELSALQPHRRSSTSSKGFRVVSGEGGRPFGLERYGKAFYVAWHYKHRVALGDRDGDAARASRRRKASPAGSPSTSGPWSTSRTPAIRRARRSTAGRSCRRRRRTPPASIAQGARRVRRDLEGADHLAELVLRARRSRRRRRRRRKSAGVRRHDAEGRADAALTPIRLGRARRPRPRRRPRRRARRRST